VFRYGNPYPPITLFASVEEKTFLNCGLRRLEALFNSAFEAVDSLSDVPLEFGPIDLFAVVLDEPPEFPNDIHHVLDG
jgi:hypothetical protein